MMAILPQTPPKNMSWIQCHIHSVLLFYFQTCDEGVDRDRESLCVRVREHNQGTQTLYCASCGAPGEPAITIHFTWPYSGVTVLRPPIGF